MRSPSRYGLWLSVLLLTACQRPSAPRQIPSGPAPAWQKVLSQKLQEYAEEQLPTLSADEMEEVLDILDLSLSGATGHRQAAHRWTEYEPAWLTAAMLQIVEGRSADAKLKRAAYAWLQEHGTEAMLPRLTLRLKYEKDWVANVDIAIGLWRWGSGAGLFPLITILRTEEGVAELEQARWAAVQAIQQLPPAPGWEPGRSFDEDWQHLLDIAQSWDQHHFFPGYSDQQPSRAVRASLWKILSQFRSQPLRPVDDARYICVRSPSWAFSALCQLCRDENRYVREHALQSLAWIGAPVGDWAVRTHFDLRTHYAPLLADARLRARVLEAMGASSLATMQDDILPWLEAEDLEWSTAAADALLRCSDAQILRPIQAFLATQPILSSEGKYSLELLWQALDPSHKASVPPNLSASEQTRREEWLAARNP